MNRSEMGQIIQAIEQHNGRPLSAVGVLALRDALPAESFATVMARLVEAAKTERWFTPAHALGTADRPNLGKYDLADGAWAEVQEIARGGGIRDLLANLDRVQWSDPATPKALREARHALRYETEDAARWAFRRAFNRHKTDNGPKAPALGAGEAVVIDPVRDLAAKISSPT